MRKKILIGFVLIVVIVSILVFPVDITGEATIVPNNSIISTAIIEGNLIEAIVTDDILGQNDIATESVNEIVDTDEDVEIIKETTVAEEYTKSIIQKTPEKLQLNGSFISIDYSHYNQNEREVLDLILEKIKLCNTHTLKEEYIILDSGFTRDSYYKIASYFYVYYGQKRAADETFDIINTTNQYGETTVKIRLRYDDIRKFENISRKNMEKIDGILTSMYDGTENEILNQIVDYLSKNIIYTDGYYELENALNGKSVCNGYALAFNTFANRAGIKSDMCIGKVNGIYHAWNRVTLKDGSYRYYDVTFYDTGGNKKYVNSKTPLHSEYSINDYTGCWFRH